MESFEDIATNTPFSREFSMIMETSLHAQLADTRSYLPKPWITGVALFTSDLLGLAVAGLLALTVMGAFVGPATAVVLGHELWLEGLLLVGYASLGLYPATGVGPVDEMRRVILVTTALYAVMLVFLVVNPLPTGLDRVTVALAWPFTLALVPAMRAVVRHLFARRSWWGTPAVVVGGRQTTDGIVARLRANPGLGVKVVARIEPETPRSWDESSDAQWEIHRDAERLKEEKRVNYAIVALPDLSPSRLDELVRELGTVLSNIVVIPTAFENTSIGITTRDAGGIVGLHVSGHLSMRRNRIMKRMLDLALLLFLAPPALVLVLLAAIAVMVVSPGNPFYWQVREGYKGRQIRIWKLRTMRRDADAVLEKYLEQDPEARTEWTNHFKLTRDPRVLPVVGRFLRRTSLDELPQIINILGGSLSFVGPRPFPPYHLEHFDDSFRALRSSVVPGLTGWWQVVSRSTADLVQQVELDSFYIHNWSLWLDLYVIARTPWAVFRGSGAW